MAVHIFCVFWTVLFVAVSCEYLSLKGNRLPNTTEINYLDRVVSENLLSCARKCKNNAMCEGIVYNDTEKWCGLADGNGFANTSQGLTGMGFKVESRVEICGRRKKMLSVDNIGGIISGSIEDLKAELLSGGKLQIVLRKQNNITLSFAVNSVLVSENLVCGKSEIYKGPTNTAEWRSYIACTNGGLHRLKTSINLTESTYFEITDYTKHNWFVFNDICQHPIFGDNSNSYITVNNMHGFSVTVVKMLDSFMKVSYKTITDIFYTGETVEMTSLEEIYSTFTGDDFKYAVNSSLITTKHKFSKSVEELRCAINDNKPCEHSEYVANQTIYIDDNWEKMFIHTSEGISAFGSLENLQGKLLKGHKILIRFHGQVREPDIVILEGEYDITAVFTMYPLKQSDSNRGKVVWEMVSTSGKYEEVVFDFVTGNVLNLTNGTRECSWFVDKATWTKVYDAYNNTVDMIVSAVEAGSNVRIKSNCLYEKENETLFYCFYSVNLLYVVSSVVNARANMYPGLTIRNSGLHFLVDEKPVWMSLVTRTNKDLKRSLWTHSSQRFPVDAKVADKDNEWFANAGIY